MTIESANDRQCPCGQTFVPQNDRFRPRRLCYKCLPEKDPDLSRAYPDLSRAYYVDERAKHPLRFDRDRHNAEKRGRAFELSGPRKRELQEQAKNGKCEATGLPFELNAEVSGNPFFPSLDRIDNDKGYLDDNVRVVVRGFNDMRRDLDDRTFHRIIVGYLNERRRRREAQGERLIWLERGLVDKLTAMRGPGESYSEVILRLVEIEVRSDG